MIVDGVMNVGVSAALFLVVAVADRAAELSMPTAVGDPAELLDVDVDQIPGSGVLVPSGVASIYGFSRASPMSSGHGVLP